MTDLSFIVDLLRFIQIKIAKLKADIYLLQTKVDLAVKTGNEIKEISNQIREKELIILENEQIITEKIDQIR